MSDSEQTKSLERRRIIFSGRVQGVFFRATSRELARSFPVSGFVRNLPDGTVEMEVQGDPRQIDAFLDAVRRHYRGNIESERAERVPVTNANERGFEIRY